MSAPLKLRIYYKILNDQAIDNVWNAREDINSIDSASIEEGFDESLAKKVPKEEKAEAECEQKRKDLFAYSSLASVLDASGVG